MLDPAAPRAAPPNSELDLSHDAEIDDDEDDAFRSLPRNEVSFHDAFFFPPHLFFQFRAKSTISVMSDETEGTEATEAIDAEMPFGALLKNTSFFPDHRMSTSVCLSIFAAHGVAVFGDSQNQPLFSWTSPFHQPVTRLFSLLFLTLILMRFWGAFF